MDRMGIHRACCVPWRRWRTVVLAAAGLWALSVRVPAHLSSAHHFPAHSPSDIAHSLADFSNQPDVFPSDPKVKEKWIEATGHENWFPTQYSVSWWVEEDDSNYTTWRYSVSFSCGPRCSGRAAVLAHDEPLAAPQHGHAARLHRVSLARRGCSSLPLVPWPQLCDELEIIAVVSGTVAHGAQLQEESRTRCSALSWLSGACARWLRAQRDLRLMHLRGLRNAPQPT